MTILRSGDNEALVAVITSRRVHRLSQRSGYKKNGAGPNQARVPTLLRGRNQRL